MMYFPYWRFLDHYGVRGTRGNRKLLLPLLLHGGYTYVSLGRE